MPGMAMPDLLYRALARGWTAVRDIGVRASDFLIDPSHHMFVGYIVTSLLIAGMVCARMVHGRSHYMRSSNSIREFLFPSQVWRTPSARLDVKYFFLHEIIMSLAPVGSVVLLSNWAFQGWMTVAGRAQPESTAGSPGQWGLAALYTIGVVALVDFIAYAIHVAQHRVPLLWEFHRVHHSPRVLNPLTNFREHPLDPFAYAVGTGVGAGTLMAVVTLLVGYTPTEVTQIVVASTLAFEGLGYHLRHSHVWLKWPKPLVYLFGCPAHHQVHHSYHPRHINKNFAFMFPFWDVLFGTFELPDTPDDIVFGIGENEGDEFRTCGDLLWVPVRRLFARVARQRA